MTLSHTHLAILIPAWLIAFGWLWTAVTSTIGLRCLPRLRDARFDAEPPGLPGVTAIVPACNEASAIRDCIQSLLLQDYGPLRIIAVDDRSTDATGAILDELARSNPERMTALHISELPTGWLGKTHAMAFAANHAAATHPTEWLLFTDGDVMFDVDAIRRSLVAAEAEHADHHVTLPTPIVRGVGEGMLLGFFQVMAFSAVRLWRVSDPQARRDSVGVGAFALLRSAAYRQIGGFEALRLEILDDLTLGRRVKLAGLRQRVALAPGMVRVHWAAGAFGVVNVLTKNVYALFRFYISLLLIACGSILIFGVAPAAGLAFRETQLPALAATVGIALLYQLAYQVSGQPRWSFILFPFAALLLVYSMLRSMLITLSQGGVMWRGTFYPLAELRKHRQPL